MGISLESIVRSLEPIVKGIKYETQSDYRLATKDFRLKRICQRKIKTQPG